MHAKNVAVSVLLAFALTACVVPHHSVVIANPPGGVPVDSSGVPIHASGPMTDTHYTVVRGDTLYSIAFRAGVDFRDLAHWNHIPAPYVIHPGRRLRITPPPHVAGVPSRPVFHTVKPPVHHVPAPTVPKPHHPAQVASAMSTTVPVAGESTPPDRAPAPASAVPSAPSRTRDGVTWRWPADGPLVDRFNAHDAIPGIEIAGKAGEPVRAAASGVVVYSGNGLVGYGELIIIKHNDTYLSAYGHNRTRLVREGERVRAGQVIARMGSSGAPRNELEFQVRRKGKPVNPEHYLPPR
jgi:lipoprotein NlpD